MPLIWGPMEAEYFRFLGLTQILKIGIDLPVGLICRGRTARLRLCEATQLAFPDDEESALDCRSREMSDEDCNESCGAA